MLAVSFRFSTACRAWACSAADEAARLIERCLQAWVEAAAEAAALASFGFNFAVILRFAQTAQWLATSQGAMLVDRWQQHASFFGLDVYAVTASAYCCWICGSDLCFVVD